MNCVLWSAIKSPFMHPAYTPMPSKDHEIVSFKGSCYSFASDWWQVFLYMDRSYVVATPGVRSLFDMGLQLFRTHLARHREVRHQRPRQMCAKVSVAVHDEQLPALTTHLLWTGGCKDDTGPAAADPGRAQRRHSEPPAACAPPAHAHSAGHLPDSLPGLAIALFVMY